MDSAVVIVEPGRLSHRLTRMQIRSAVAWMFRPQLKELKR
jgi:hypothetical protein